MQTHIRFTNVFMIMTAATLLGCARHPAPPNEIRVLDVGGDRGVPGDTLLYFERLNHDGAAVWYEDVPTFTLVSAKDSTLYRRPDGRPFAKNLLGSQFMKLMTAYEQQHGREPPGTVINFRLRRTVLHLMHGRVVWRAPTVVLDDVRLDALPDLQLKVEASKQRGGGS